MTVEGKEREYFKSASLKKNKFIFFNVGFLLFILYPTENDGVWGHWVVGNDEEAVLGLKSFDTW